MTEIMCMLANDHRNMTKILDALQRRISSLDHAGPLNYHLIRNILGYILDYPTQVHHPVEDLVYGELRSAIPPSPGLSTELNRSMRISKADAAVCPGD